MFFRDRHTAKKEGQVRRGHVPGTQDKLFPLSVGDSYQQATCAFKTPPLNVEKIHSARRFPFAVTLIA